MSDGFIIYACIGAAAWVVACGWVLLATRELDGETVVLFGFLSALWLPVILCLIAVCLFSAMSEFGYYSIRLPERKRDND